MYNDQNEVKSRYVMVFERTRRCREFASKYCEHLGQAIYAFNDLFTNFSLDSEKYNRVSRIELIESLANELKNDYSHYFNLLKNDTLDNAIANWSAFDKLFQLLKELKYNELQHAANLDMLDTLTDIQPVTLPFPCFRLS